MYICTRGRLQVVDTDGKTVLATLKAGSYFGEISILNMGTAGKLTQQPLGGSTTPGPFYKLFSTSLRGHNLALILFLIFLYMFKDQFKPIGYRVEF